MDRENLNKNLKYNYKIYSPCGNDTALVLGDNFTQEERVIINSQIISERKNIEQVGFLCLEKDKYKLTMAGGEFCGNAVRCAAFYYLDGKMGNLEIEICGEKINAGINSDGEVWVEIAKADYNKIADGIYLCKMNGINHIVVTEENKEALGVMFYKNVNEINNINIMGKINPIVYVPSADTCFNETACLSGTAATVSVLIGEKINENNSNNIIEIEQPSGKILNACLNNNKNNLIIKGEVIKLEE